MPKLFKSSDWLPTSVKEIKAIGWDYLDVIIFSGDAYVDHPSFGASVIGRLLQKLELKVAIVPQPNWNDDLRDFKKLGRPNLFFGVTAGNMDSMVNHYTANKRLRSNDAYTPDGKAGFRPDYASEVYCKILKTLYPETPVVLGGIESSLRRLTHYDYWSDSLKPSALIDTKADLLLYGMAEKAIKELVIRLKSGEKIADIRNLKQSVYLQNSNEPLIETTDETLFFHSFEICKKDKKAYAENFWNFEIESNKMVASRIVEAYGDKIIVVNPPYSELSQEDIDETYDLPYTRLPHPRYFGKGKIPAFDMIKHSVNTHRGCFGGCSFCTISAHQGKFVQSRSEKSILKEIEEIVENPEFKGTITDLGGPSANMYKMKGKHEAMCTYCKRSSCIFPKVCPNLDTDHSVMTDLYKKVAAVPGIKHVFVGSGLRYDLLYDNENPSKDKREYLKNLVQNHVSGRLKVAPEHTSDDVLNMMRKPSFQLFKKFNADFEKINKEAGKKQQLIPYFISSHPGSKLSDMAELASETKRLNFRLEQVQDFTPTPMTLSACIFYTGINPYNAEKVFSPKTIEDKKAQQSFFFWYKPEMRNFIRKNLEKIGRKDLEKKLL